MLTAPVVFAVSVLAEDYFTLVLSITFTNHPMAKSRSCLSELGDTSKNMGLVSPKLLRAGQCGQIGPFWDALCGAWTGFGLIYHELG